MNKKNITLLLAGTLAGAILTAGSLTLRADDPPPDATMEMLKKLHEQHEKLLAGQDAIKKELSDIKSDVQFIRAASRQ
jgi:hypothetical protein